MGPLAPLAPFQSSVFCWVTTGVLFEMSVEEKADVVEWKTLEKVPDNDLSHIQYVLFSGQYQLYGGFICTQTEYLQVSRFVFLPEKKPSFYVFLFSMKNNLFRRNPAQWTQKQTFFLCPYFAELGRVFSSECSDSRQSSHMQENNLQKIISHNPRPYKLCCHNTVFFIHGAFVCWEPVLGFNGDSSAERRWRTDPASVCVLQRYSQASLYPPGEI